jgi:hypothetical protein
VIHSKYYSSFPVPSGVIVQCFQSVAERMQ